MRLEREIHAHVTFIIIAGWGRGLFSYFDSSHHLTLCTHGMCELASFDYY